MPLPYSKRKGYYQDRYKKKKEQTGVKSSPPDFTPQKFTPPTVTKIDQQLAKVITAALQQINQANTLFRQEIREHLLQQASSNAEVLKIVNQLGEKVNKLRQKPQTSQQLGQTKFGISWKLSPGGKKLLAAAIKQLEIETGISKGDPRWENQVRRKALNSLPEIKAKQRLRNKKRWEEIKNLLAWVDNL